MSIFNSYDAWKTYIPEPSPLPYFKRKRGNWVLEYDEWMIIISHIRHPLYVVFECSEGVDDKAGEIVYKRKTIASPIPLKWQVWIMKEWNDIIYSLQDREEEELRKSGR